MAPLIVGLISDTHGLLRPEAVHALGASDLLIHAGDVGDPQILAELEHIAPLRAVRGNVDSSGPCGSLPATYVVEADGCLIYVLHDIAELDLDPKAAGIAVVVFGHSHRPIVETRREVLFVNPGSAGPRRFKLPVTVAHLMIDGDTARAEIIELEV